MCARGAQATAPLFHENEDAADDAADAADDTEDDEEDDEEGEAL